MISFPVSDNFSFCLREWRRLRFFGLRSFDWYYFIPLIIALASLAFLTSAGEYVIIMIVSASTYFLVRFWHCYTMPASYVIHFGSGPEAVMMLMSPVRWIL